MWHYYNGLDKREREYKWKQNLIKLIDNNAEFIAMFSNPEMFKKYKESQDSVSYVSQTNEMSEEEFREKMKTYDHLIIERT